jgi:hypothetical protein
MLSTTRIEPYGAPTAGAVSVSLVPPVLQAGAGIGMAPMRLGQQ